MSLLQQHEVVTPRNHANTAMMCLRLRLGHSGVWVFAVCTQVDQWIDTSSQLVSGPGFDMLCGRLNDYLSMRSFLVGFTTTAADFSIWGQLHGEARLVHLPIAADACCYQPQLHQQMPTRIDIDSSAHTLILWPTEQ
jgi:hypothetical protein